jgi:hypothetical protein
MGDIQQRNCKGQNMRHEETRDNTTAIEATIIEADNRDMTPVDMDNPREGVFPAVVVREVRHEERNDGANGYDDEPEDDGQPSEYDEWQDYMGGDEYYDHSENACW